MKPIKLIISAFGPYAETMPEIDFTSLEADGLFLISGETGAGKTTIFDAMVFALFGKTSGVYRDVKYLKSEYAKAGVESFVEFTFSHRGKTYTVRRSPSYLRPKARGEGFVEQKETAVLTPEGETPTEGLTAVGGKLAEVLNFDYARFRQVAMIAQGEFLKLLNATTEERTGILRGIFMTESYAKLAKELKRLEDESYVSSENARRSVVQYFEGVRLDGHEAQEEQETGDEEDADPVAEAADTSERGGPEDADPVAEAAGIAESGDEAAEAPAGDGTDAGRLSERYTDILDTLHAAKIIVNGGELVSFVDSVVEADREEQERVTAKADAAAKAYEALRAERDAAKEGNAALDLVESRRAELAKIKSDADKAAEYGKKADLIDAAAKIKPLYDAYLDQEMTVRRLRAEIKETGRNLTEEQDIYDKAVTAKEQADEKAGELPALKTRISLIEANKADYEKRDKAAEDSKTHSKAFDREEKRLRELEQKKAELLKEEEELTRQREALKDSAAALATAKADDGKLEKQKNVARDLQTRCKDLLDDESCLAQKQQDATAKIEALDLATKERARYEKIFDGCRAGLLAEKLESGSPCPVCGSTEHPMCAKLPKERVTEEEVEDLRNAESEAARSKEEAVRAAGSLLAVVTERQEKLRLDLEDLLEEADQGQQERETEAGRKAGSRTAHQRQGQNGVSAGQAAASTSENLFVIEKLCGNLESRAKAAAAHLIDCEKQFDLLGKTEKKLGGIKDSKSEIETAIEAARSARDEASKLLDADRFTLESLKSLEFESLKEALAFAGSLKEKAASIEQEQILAQKRFEESGVKKAELKGSLDSATKQLDSALKAGENAKKKFEGERAKTFANDELFLENLNPGTPADKLRELVETYKKNLSEAEALLKDAERKAKGKQRLDTEELDRRVRELNEEHLRLVSGASALGEQIKSNLATKDRISEKLGEYEEASSRLSINRRLYRLVSGNTGGSVKVTLEQYVQAAGFDGIIAAANKRLSVMSDGQFELCRKRDISGKRSMEALDLEVLDNYTGTRRPVGNLSGGESFKASLSLALGLSDTMSLRRGGLQMDALFVDEGFGTLDGKSIEGALEILTRLSGTGKLVGVISHRDELKENIRQQIYVEKTKNGSRFKIIT